MLNMFSKMSFFGLLTMSAAFAQSEQAIQAKVPFAFTVSNTTLPAGKYQLTYSSSAQRMTVQGLDANPAAAFATAFPTISSNSSSQPGKLLFNCYDGACHLAQVWQGPVGGDRGLQVVGTERRHAVSISARVVAVSVPTTNLR